MRSVTLLFLFVGFFSVNAFSQGCCSGGAPLSSNLEVAAAEANTFSLRLIYDYNNLGSVVAGSQLLEDDTRTRLTKTGLLRLEYGLNKRWTFSGLFTFVRQSEKVRFGDINNVVFGQGFGDLVLMSQFNAINRSTTKLSIGGGVKFPTGAINELNESTSLLLPPDLQPGAGSWDYIAMAWFSKRNLLVENLNFNAGTTFRANTSAPRFDQQQEYKFGNVLQSFIGVSHNFEFKKIKLIPQATVRYRYARHDETNGFKTINTGGHWVYLRGELESFFNNKIGVSFRSEIPVYWNLTGIQLTTSYRLTAGLIFNFQAQKGAGLNELNY